MRFENTHSTVHMMMFESYAQLHVHAAFSMLLPEESQHAYKQVHMDDNPDGPLHACTQFQHCESNVFATSISQADNYAGWYSTGQSNWLGQAVDPANDGQYMVDDQPYGGVAGNVSGHARL